MLVCSGPRNWAACCVSSDSCCCQRYDVTHGFHDDARYAPGGTLAWMFLLHKFMSRCRRVSGWDFVVWSQTLLYDPIWIRRISTQLSSAFTVSKYYSADPPDLLRSEIIWYFSHVALDVFCFLSVTSVTFSMYFLVRMPKKSTMLFD